MGEGTKVFDVQAELTELKRRIDAITAVSITAQKPPAGCVCPAGAEKGCGSPFCPRRAPPGYCWPAHIG